MDSPKHGRYDKRSEGQMTDPKATFAAVSKRISGELRKSGFKGTAGRFERDAPEAHNIVFLQKDRQLPNETQVRFQIVCCAYLKLLDAYFRKGRMPRHFTTADADFHTTVGAALPPSPHLWWTVTEATEPEEMMNELRSLLHEALSRLATHSSLQTRYAELLNLHSAGKLSTKSVVELAILAKHTGESPVYERLSDQLRMSEAESPFVRAMLQQLAASR